jgi:tetratricopeptide (TPR) repeat protein
MSAHLRRSSAAFAAALLIGALAAQGARADAGASKDAGKHFTRAVTLYGEADYHGALVEFRRAFTLAPNAAVLYNIAETQYQLQDYAGALTTFQRYLTEAPANAPHRTEVESNVEVLKARVGHLTITTVPPGADVTLDDQAAGKTPLDKMLVSIGHRKVIASMAGRSAVTKYVDVAADDDVSVTLTLPEEATPAMPVVAPLGPPPPTTTQPPASAGSSSAWRVIGWVTTGTLAAGAAVMGVLAVNESNELKDSRGTIPVQASTLTHEGNLTQTYSILADSLAAVAVVVGGITLYSTLSAPRTGSPRESNPPGTRVTLGPGSVRLEMSF